MISVKLGCVTGGSVSVHMHVSALLQMQNVLSVKELSGTTVGCSHLRKSKQCTDIAEVIVPVFLT